MATNLVFLVFFVTRQSSLVRVWGHGPCPNLWLHQCLQHRIHCHAMQSQFHGMAYYMLKPQCHWCYDV